MPRLYNIHHGNAPDDAVYIGRTTIYGCPFVIGVDGTREEVVRKYYKWLKKRPGLQNLMRHRLKGKDLVCSCYPELCHGDIILQIANI